MENNLSIQAKEQLIIGTIISCNGEIAKFSDKFGNKTQVGKNIKNLMESENLNLYHYNMVNLFCDVSGINYIQLNESFDQIISENNYIKNTRENYYSYFQKVHNFLSGFEVPLQKSLNESLVVDDKMVENPIQQNIFTFKDDLKKLIIELENSNDLDKIPANILKIKTFAKHPIFICGYNICGNLALKKELFENFHITDKDLIAICFDKSNKQILFVTKSTSNLIAYDLKSDNLDYYNKINEDKIPTQTLTGLNYLSVLKELINNNLLEIFISVDSLGLKFSDNLYKDQTYALYMEKMKANSPKSIMK